MVFSASIIRQVLPRKGYLESTTVLEETFYISIIINVCASSRCCLFILHDISEILRSFVHVHFLLCSLSEINNKMISFQYFFHDSKSWKVHDKAAKGILDPSIIPIATYKLYVLFITDFHHQKITKLMDRQASTTKSTRWTFFRSQARSDTSSWEDLVPK